MSNTLLGFIVGCWVYTTILVIRIGLISLHINKYGGELKTEPVVIISQGLFVISSFTLVGWLFS